MNLLKQWLPFSCGIVTGVLFSSFLCSFKTDLHLQSYQTYKTNTRELTPIKYVTTVKPNVNTVGLPEVTTSSFLRKLVNSTPAVNKTTSSFSHEVRVLCWIMTSPETLYTKAIHVNATWGHRCNKVLFMSSVEDKAFPAVGLPVKEGRENLYEKTKKAFRYVWKNHRNDADWFMKADDDTYVIVENLRFLLKPYDPKKPMYFGRKFKPYVKQGYMSGGSGYVLSKAALRRYDIAIQSLKCPHGFGAEDVAIGNCLNQIGVKAMDSRDAENRDRFFPLEPKFHLTPGHIGPKDWFWDYIYYPNPIGPQCCSQFAVSFHYINPDLMHVLEYFIYRFRVFEEDKFAIPNSTTEVRQNNATTSRGNEATTTF